MGLVWLESQESFINRGLIGTMEDYVEAEAKGKEVNWEEYPFSKDDPSCLSETASVSHQEELLGDLFDRASLEFDQDRLFAASFSYTVKWDAESQSIDLESIDEVYRTLHSQLSSKYGQGSDYDSMVAFDKGPVRIGLSRSTTKNDDPQFSFGRVSLESYFNIDKYNTTLDQ